MNLQTLENGSKVCPDDPGEPTTGIRRISVTDEEAAFLAVLARGKKVLEIGTGLGVSTRALASTASFVMTIDIDPWVLDNVALKIQRDSEIEVSYRSDIESLQDTYEMVFIDGDHRTDRVMVDLFHAYSRVPLKGMIVVHDAKMPEVAAALDDTWIHVDTHHGLAIKII